ncbi:MAG TPA: aminoacetone oxidase family FAD-binding enzyme [Bacilli bacterium]|nr:aminoacetone oxidase family FAD-binding enzyme [Bacilli bacterium]
MKRIAIIGAGACGLWTALALAKSKQRFSIDIFERFDNVGKKIAMSGNSRGNLGNTNVRPQAYNNPIFVASLIGKYDADWSIDAFESFGVKVLSDEAGRLYPISEHAKSIVMQLKSILNTSKVQIHENHPIANIDHDATMNTYIIEGRTYDQVVIATGSNAGLGPTISPSSIPTINHQVRLNETRRFPALCAIGVTGDIRLLENIRVKAKLTLMLGNHEYGAKGEVQFIHNAISGIAAFVLSSYIARSMVAHGKLENPSLLILDLLPTLSYRQLRAYLAKHVDETTFDRHSLTGLFHQNVSAWLYARYREGRPAGFNTDAMVELIKHVAFNIDINYMPRNNQVLAGGVATYQVNSDTLECYDLPNLYIGGEALDIDGLCGGYNLHYAFACGEAIASVIIKKASQ